jgi:putative hydroxymethylpyrimidine transport system substrate-binding protein
MRRPLAAVLLLILAALAAACGGGGPAGPQKVTLVLDWFINPDHAGIIAAKTKGFFAEEGLEVTLQVPSDPSDPPKLVAAGAAEIAISYQPDVLLARAEGVPIVAIGAIVPTPLNSIQVLESSAITHPRDLAGKTIGNPGIPANTVYLHTILRQVGVDPSSVKEVDVGYDLLPALIGKRVDAVIGPYWNIEAIEAELLGYPVRVFHLEEWGVPDYDELVFITSEKTAKDKKDLLKRFLRAAARGHAYVVDNLEEAVELLLSEAPELKREAVELQVEELASIWEDADVFGEMSLARWQGFADFLHANQLVKTRLDARKAMTNEFLELGE